MAMAITIADIKKIAGCYVPARLAGKLSHTGSMIVGIGMVPRGEVGLIIAGAGLITGAISREIFGIAVALSILTVLIVPTMLKPLFRRSVTTPKKTESKL